MNYFIDQPSLFLQKHNRNSLWMDVLLATALAVAFHFALSWASFNPTDDGFILSYSRRLLEGQVSAP
jgi:hypothetical protein